jgi:glycosyltransferase involved in cell wall biosynthesis/SAM-dependent methyltransferase
LERLIVVRLSFYIFGDPALHTVTITESAASPNDEVGRMSAISDNKKSQAGAFPQPGSILPTASPVANSHAQMRILFIIDQICGVGGAELMLLKMIRHLSARGYRCHAVTFKIDPSLDIFATFPCPLHVFPLKRTYDWNALRTAARIRRLIREEHITIVHTFFPTSNLWGATVAKLSGSPVLVSSRRDMGILRTRKHRLAYPIVDRLVDQVVAVSNAVRDFSVRQERLNPSKVLVLHNAIDLDTIRTGESRESVRTSLGLKQSSRLIVSLANIRHVKGIDVLIRSAQSVHREFPEAVFVVVGSEDVDEKPYFRQMQELIRESGLTECFKLIGPAKNVFPILRASDIFCMLSRSEGFSNALLEAMACRLPCVVTNVGGNPEAIADGENGFLVPSEDAEAAAERILTLLRRPELALKLGNAARQTIESRFTLEVMTKRLEKMYENLLNKRGEHSEIRFRHMRIMLRIAYCRLTRRPLEVLRRHQYNLYAVNGWADFLDSPHLVLTEKALKDMKLSPGARILDLGCGGGLASRMLAGALGERCSVMGVDISDEMVHRARAKSKQFKNLNFLCSSASRVPVPDDFFSHVLCIEAFYYFEDPETVLRELLRVTATQGQISLVLCLYKDHVLSLGDVNKVTVPVQVRSAAEYKQLLEGAGWANVNCEDYVWKTEPGQRPRVHDRALYVTARKPGGAVASRQEDRVPRRLAS